MVEPTQDTTPKPAPPKPTVPKPGPPRRRQEQSAGQVQGGQVSEGPSGFGGAETSGGGADAVPDTPDANPGTAEPIRDSGADGS
jgi:hypothetical protein